MNEKKRVGVIAAIEVDSVLAEYGEAKHTENLCGFSLRQYDSEQCTLFVLSSGAGEIAAAAATQLLIDHCKVDILVNFGVVGALSAEMATAERCVVRRVVHYDFDTRAWLGLPVGQYPGYETPYVSADEALLQKALTADPALRPVTCASADKFVDSAADKQRLHDTFAADICDMESAGILLTARRCGVPCLLIKAVSDGLGGGAEEFLSELDRVSRLCFRTVDRILRAGV